MSPFLNFCYTVTDELYEKFKERLQLSEKKSLDHSHLVYISRSSQ